MMGVPTIWNEWQRAHKTRPILVGLHVSYSQQTHCLSDLHKMESQFEAKHVMMYTNHIQPLVHVSVHIWHLRHFQVDDGGQKLLCHRSDLIFLRLQAQLQGHHELQDCGDVHGDRLLCGLCVWMDPGLLHHAHRDLDLVRGGQHRSDHFKLLLQPVEGLYIWFDWSVWLQGNSINACTEL